MCVCAVVCGHARQGCVHCVCVCGVYKVYNDIIIMCYSIHSYFLHSISHPNKHGMPLFNLSQDVKARIENQENRTENQVKLERVIRHVYTEYGLSHHLITESVRSLFKAKLWRMGQRLAIVGSIKHP